MKKKILICLTLITMFSLVSINFASAKEIASKLKGRILLQVENNGEAWYITPKTEERFFLGRPMDAFNVMRELGLGISEKSYNSFNNVAPARLSGQILLRVEENGEAYYVDPIDLKLYYLGRPADAFELMRNKGLGITNSDLKKIGIAEANKKVVEEYLRQEALKGFSKEIREMDGREIERNITIKEMHDDYLMLEYFDAKGEKIVSFVSMDLTKNLFYGRKTSEIISSDKEIAKEQILKYLKTSSSPIRMFVSESEINDLEYHYFKEYSWFYFVVVGTPDGSGMLMYVPKDYDYIYTSFVDKEFYERDKYIDKNKAIVKEEIDKFVDEYVVSRCGEVAVSSISSHNTGGFKFTVKYYKNTNTRYNTFLLSYDLEDLYYGDELSLPSKYHPHETVRSLNEEELKAKIVEWTEINSQNYIFKNLIKNKNHYKVVFELNGKEEVFFAPLDAMTLFPDMMNIKQFKETGVYRQ